MREDIIALGERIAEQAVHLDAAMNRLLIDLHHFDQAGGWAMQHFQSCAHWLSWRVGWDLATARDRVRLANRLPALPKVRAKLEAGELSYSKARAIARVATPVNEEVLLLYAEHLPAAQLERVCGKLHTVEVNDRTRKEGRVPDQHERIVEARSLGDGMTCIKVVLQAEEAALLMNVIHTAAKTCTASEDRLKRWSLSPPATAGTRSTGITGAQGPGRWRADGSSPCSRRIQARTSSPSIREGDREHAARSGTRWVAGQEECFVGRYPFPSKRKCSARSVRRSAMT